MNIMCTTCKMVSREAEETLIDKVAMGIAVHCPSCNRTEPHELHHDTATFAEFLGVVTGREAWEVRPWGEDFSDTEMKYINADLAVFNSPHSYGCSIRMEAKQDGTMVIQFVSCRDGEEIHYVVPHITHPCPVVCCLIEAPSEEEMAYL